ncbi:conjugal transfer protein TraL [Desulfovibrio sp.]|uniref:nucleotide-binding protein n=1 Tax=Desulfovibrio sp. TaxID=885 RepID=UPI0025C285A4|nr:conjugal transfer protein TraL [Desulfovibrio sp.]
MATIHFILQGKGGVGKSMIAAFLYQAAAACGKSVEAFDTDPINATLAGYKSFDVTRIDILDESGAIDPLNFDELVEKLAHTQCEHVIVDCGASSFVEFGNYIRQSNVLELLQEGDADWNGHQILLHTVVTGGQATSDTIFGLQQLTQEFAEQSIVLWLNPYFGRISVAAAGDKPVGEFLAERCPSIIAVIALPEIKGNYGADLERMLGNHETFAEAEATVNIASKGRLRNYWNTVRADIARVNII